MSNQFKIMYLETSCRELSIDICMGRIGGGAGGGLSFLDPPSKNLLGHSYKILNTSAESSAQAQSFHTLFNLIELRGGSCGHVQWSEAHALGCRPRVSQANEAAIHSKLTGLCQHDIVSGILKKWKQCGTV